MGDWKEGRADEFGWDVHNPLIARIALGKNRGVLPATGSFVAVDCPNVVCTTIKPAEANGAGSSSGCMKRKGERPRPRFHFRCWRRSARPSKRV